MKIVIAPLLVLCAAQFVCAQETITSDNKSPATQSTNVILVSADEVPAEDKNGFQKKSSRWGFIFGGSKQWIDEYTPLPEYGNEYNAIGNIRVYYEQFNLFGFQHEDAGVGFDLNFVDSFEGYLPGSHPTSPDIFYAKKLYLSGYAFRDFDLGNIITVGVMGGPSIVTNFVTTDREASNYEGVATSMGIGIHTGQYILKYIGRGDQKKFCLRLGFEQYISINSGFTGLFGAGLGF